MALSAAAATLIGAGISAAGAGAKGAASIANKKSIAAEQLALSKYNQMLQSKAQDYLLKSKEGQLRGQGTMNLLGLAKRDAAQNLAQAYDWLGMIESIINNRPDIRDRLLNSYLRRVG
jgi:hypothetical protein